MSDFAMMVTMTDLGAQDELCLILCSLVGWLFFSRLGRFAESRHVLRLSLEAKLAGEENTENLPWKDSKLEEGWMVMFRRSVLAAAMKRCEKSPKAQKSLKSLRRVSFCEEVKVRACPSRERPEWERSLKELDVVCADAPITPDEYQEMVRKAIRPC